MYVKEFIQCLELRPLISVHHIAHPQIHYILAFDEDIPMEICENSVRMSTVLKNPSYWVVDTQDEVTQRVIYGAISIFAVVKRSLRFFGFKYTLIELKTNRVFASANSKHKLVINVLDKIKKKEISLKCKS